MTASIALGDAFEFIRNGMNVRQTKDAGGIPITRIETISAGSIDLDRVGYAGLQKEDAEKWFLEPGDILLSHINSVEHIGKCALFEDAGTPLIHGMNLLAMRPKRNLLFPRYAMWAMKDPSFKSRILKFVNKAVNQASISTTNLKTVEIPLPPLEEQKRIAGILDQADALRRLRTRALDKLNTLGQAIFHEMFGDLISNERGFEPAEIGDLIEGFETGKNLAEDPDANRLEGYRVLKISAVTSGTFKPEESKPLPLDYEPPDQHIVRDGDLLFSRANTAQLIGATAFARTTNSNLVLPDKLWRFVWKTNSKVLPEFVKELFSSPPFRNEIGKRSSGTSGSMKNIGKQKVLSILFGLPSQEMQSQFLKRLSVSQDQISIYIKLLQKSDALFASLQHRAFRGEL